MPREGIRKARATPCKTGPQIAADWLAEVDVGFEGMIHPVNGSPRAEGVDGGGEEATLARGELPLVLVLARD